MRPLLDSFAPYLLPESRRDIAELLVDVFTWSGVLRLWRGRVVVSPPLPGASLVPHVHAHTPDALTISLPASATLPLARMLSFARVQADKAIIDAESVRRAVAQGLTAADVVDTLGEVPEDVIKRIEGWATQAQRLTLRQITVLHADDPAVIDQLDDTRRLSDCFDERLSPHHLTIAAGQAQNVVSRLGRRGLPVTTIRPPREDSPTDGGLSPDMADYLLLAVRTYQKLSSRLSAPVSVPKAVAHWLSARAHAPQDMEAHADALTATVQKHVPANGARNWRGTTGHGQRLPATAGRPTTRTPGHHRLSQPHLRRQHPRHPGRVHRRGIRQSLYQRILSASRRAAHVPRRPGAARASLARFGCGLAVV